jgi:hypothetical protein
MRVYVAGAWVEQWERARPMIARLREAGIDITHDWTVAEQRHREHDFVDTEYGSIQIKRCRHCRAVADGVPCLPLVDSDITPAERALHARNDLKGVLLAEVVLLLAANDKGACGSWVEMGAALAARDLRGRQTLSLPYIIVCGEKNRRTIFTELADQLCATDDDGFAAVMLLR